MDKGYARPTARARDLRNNATAAERALWQAISARKVSGVRFNRQVPVGPYICDFVARSIGLVIEVDAARTRYIEAYGFRLIRFWNNDVLENLVGVVAAIGHAIVNIPSPDPSREREGGRMPDTPCP